MRAWKPARTALKWQGIAFILALTGPICGQVTITGNFRNPDSTTVSGKLTVQLTLPTITNNCTSPAQVATMAPVTVAITAGSLGTLVLYPSTCLSVVPPSTGAPVIYTGSAAGGGATVTMSGNSVSGSFTLTTGTTPLPGVRYVFTTGQSGITQSTLVTMLLATVNGNQPFCTTTPSSTNAILSGAQSTFQIYPKSTTMTLVAGTSALAASTAYTWNYSCVQPYTVVVYDTTGRQLYKGFWSVPNAGSADVTVLGQ